MLCLCKGFMPTPLGTRSSWAPFTTVPLEVSSRADTRVPSRFLGPQHAQLEGVLDIVVGRLMPPHEDVHILISRTCEYVRLVTSNGGVKVADGIKVLERGNFSWIIWVSPV